MGAEERELAVAFWVVVAVLAAIVAAGFIPLFGGYSFWGWIRLLFTADWRH